MLNDPQLLRRYAEDNSEEAFAELVRRHLDLVHSAALRQVEGDPHDAQDVAQQVFTLLARKARSLARHPTLSGWLYLCTQHVAAKTMRGEWRRRAREQKAATMSAAAPLRQDEVDWDRMRPVLDAAMRELKEVDREAVLLRFFARRGYPEIGAALDLSEDGARRRVERALDKLRALLAQRGVTSAAAVLGTALENNAVGAAPAGLATVVTGCALSGAAAIGPAAIVGWLSSAPLVPVAAVGAAILALFAAGFQEREYRAADAALVVSRRKTAEVSGQHKALLERAAVTSREVEELRQKLAQERRTPPVESPTAASGSLNVADAQDKAMRANRDFLAAHPEGQRWMDEQGRHMANEFYGLWLRRMNLEPAEVDRILTEMAKFVPWQIGPLSGNPDRAAEFERLRDLLGEPGYQRFQRIRDADVANGVVKVVAVVTMDTDVPLLATQARALTEIIERHRTVQRSDAGMTVYALDWTAISREAAGVLSRPQFIVFTAAVQRGVPTTQGEFHPKL